MGESTQIYQIENSKSSVTIFPSQGDGVQSRAPMSVKMGNTVNDLLPKSSRRAKMKLHSGKCQPPPQPDE